MQFAVGDIYEGKVTGITKFGAFVEFAEGKTGMVHISEVASAFVKEITDFVKVGQQVKVKIIAISDEGKVSLSMKKAEPEAAKPKNESHDNFTKSDRRTDKRTDERRAERKDFKRQQDNESRTQNARPGDFEWQAKSNSGGSFEDMMSRFKLQSDEKISDLKKNTETKRGSFSTRRERNM